MFTKVEYNSKGSSSPVTCYCAKSCCTILSFPFQQLIQSATLFDKTHLRTPHTHTQLQLNFVLEHAQPFQDKKPFTQTVLADLVFAVFIKDSLI